MSGAAACALEHVAGLALHAFPRAEQDGRILAGALWDPPGRWRVSLAAQLRQLPGLLKVLGSRTFAVMHWLGEIEREHPIEPHWYLAVLGTDPSAQGHGLGSALLQSRLSRCDDRRFPAYLESSKESNVPYYERFGFAAVSEPYLEDGVPHAAHQVHLVTVDAGRISRDTVFCGGRWPAALLAEMEAARGH